VAVGFPWLRKASSDADKADLSHLTNKVFNPGIETSGVHLLFPYVGAIQQIYVLLNTFATDIDSDLSALRKMAATRPK